MNYVRDKASQIEKKNIIIMFGIFILINSNLPSNMDPTDETCTVNK